jgi:hypothetical protein
MNMRTDLESKFQPLTLKPLDASGVFEGYASLFGAEDLSGDIVERGAFAESLARRGPAGIRLLFQHDPAEPIGIWEEIREDARGLFVRGRLLPDVARAREVLSLMQAGALDGLSIGFKPLMAKRDARKGVRRILRVDLWEISIVTFPMLPGARISAVKSRPFAQRAPTERELERWLVLDAGLSRSEARGLMAQGFKAVAAKRDAGRDTAAAALAARFRAAAEILRN